MDPTTDPLNLLLTGGGGGAATGVVAYYLLNRVVRNGNGSNGSPSDTGTADALREVAHKLDTTNELLNEMLRGQARLEGMMQQRHT